MQQLTAIASQLRIVNIYTSDSIIMQQLAMQLATSYSVYCVTMQLQCTLCHYVATVYTVSLCSYSVHCVTMQLQCTLCHYVATVYTVSPCSYSVHCVTMQLHCTLCHHVATLQLHCVTMYVATVYTVSPCSNSVHCVTMNVQLQCILSHCVSTV